MSVIMFQPRAWMDFEGRAVKKIAELSELMLALPAYIDGLDPDVKEHVTIAELFHLFDLIDEMIEFIERKSPALIPHMKPEDQAVFEVQCALTNIRAKAFGKIRCSRMFISDIALENTRGIDDLGDLLIAIVI